MTVEPAAARRVVVLVVTSDVTRNSYFRFCRGRRPGVSDHRTRQRTGMGAVSPGHDAGDHGAGVAGGGLCPSAGTSREVVPENWMGDLQVGERDDVEVGFLASGQHTCRESPRPRDVLVM